MCLVYFGEEVNTWGYDLYSILITTTIGLLCKCYGSVTESYNRKLDAVNISISYFWCLANSQNIFRELRLLKLVIAVKITISYSDFTAAY